MNNFILADAWLLYYSNKAISPIGTKAMINCLGMTAQEVYDGLLSGEASEAVVGYVTGWHKHQLYKSNN